APTPNPENHGTWEQRNRLTRGDLALTKRTRFTYIQGFPGFTLFAGLRRRRGACFAVGRELELGPRNDTERQ
ncbi:MAG: hypothetical protein ACUVQK_03770, partial [Thermogutta sp.]